MARNSITRLTQFYDIEKVFSSTLEMDEFSRIRQQNERNARVPSR